MSPLVPRRRILVVDDDSRITRMLLRVAKKMGFEASAISDPGDFDEAYEQLDPHILLLDLSMPGVDGVELLRRLAGNGSNTEIFLMSGVDARVLDTTTLLGTELGLKMSGALPKPIDLDVLRTRLLGVEPELASVELAAPVEAAIDEASLREAIEAGQLEVAYQPKVDLASGRPCGAEALVRWRHPEFGQIFPDRFIPLSEETGLVVPLTYCVVEHTLTDAARWGELADGLNFAVNLSPLLLDDLELPDRLAERLERCEFDTSRLVLEVTETAAMENPARWMDVLTRLRIKGFGLSIDDFGTGSSYLTQLYRLPYAEIKVDRSFVLGVTKDHEAAAIVHSIVELGHNLGLRVVAEGIEDQETLDWLTELGCDIGQGYYLGRPMSAECFADWLRQHV